MSDKPRFGRKGEQPDEPLDERPDAAAKPLDPIDLGALARVFLLFAVAGLVTSVIMLTESDRIFDSAVMPIASQPVAPVLPGTADVAAQGTEPVEKADPNDPDSKYPIRNYTPIGPFQIQKSGVVLTVDLHSSLPNDKWAFVEAELLDAEKDYIFSFGQEFWRESGSDSDGPWTETDDRFSMKLTIPSPGSYYIGVKAQGNIVPDRIYATISRRLGSSIPHFVFGMLTLLIAWGLNEYQNRTTMRIIAAFTEKDDD